jgi:hypothetical protein
MLHSVDVATVVDALERDGYFLGLRVQPELVQESVPYWRDKKPGVHIDAHLDCPAIARITRDSSILSVARSYFGCVVNLVECKVFISGENTPDSLSSGFHFDHAGLRSLNVIVYLNDVDEDRGPHVFVAGTHRNKKFRDFLREMTSIPEIERRYAGRIMTVTGSAGTVLLENAEVFHRRELARQRRAALIVVYSTGGRRLLSIGKDLRTSSQPAS